MKTYIRNRAALVLVASVAASSCTMKDQEAPPLTGPSEFSTSVSMQITPDVLQLDGASQAVIAVTVRDFAAQPMRNVALRADIVVGGQTVDFGSLSTKSIVTGADGRATMIYTAPAVNAESEAIVDIVVIPVGTNYDNAIQRSASIRLIPTGIRVPPSDLVPAFTFAPTTPSQAQPVLFDATESKGTIAQYRWDFGDGSIGSGRTATHAFSGPGTYFVRLTLVDPIGRTASTTRSVTIGQTAAPVAEFSMSPTDPQPADLVNFNASASTAAAGRRIVSYAWDFGDGGTATGAHTSHRYTIARTYTVTLTVTDDVGRTATISKALKVAVPEDDGGQPTH